MLGTRCLGYTLPLLALVLGCGGDGRKYAGTWKRDLYGEGEIQMKLAANGGVELMLPSPRWPDSVDMKGQASFKGDTMVFKADTATRACQTQDRSAERRVGKECRSRWSP